MYADKNPSSLGAVSDMTVRSLGRSKIGDIGAKKTLELVVIFFPLFLQYPSSNLCISHQ